MPLTSTDRLETRRFVIVVAVALTMAFLLPTLAAQGPGGPPPADVSVGGLLGDLCDPIDQIRPVKHAYEVRDLRPAKAPFARRKLDLGRDGAFDCVVLADLAGPGAVVELGCGARSGRLFFFFDGDERPRIDLNLEHLAQGLIPVFRPPLSVVGKDRLTLRLPLTFEKSLQILAVDEPLPLSGVWRRYEKGPSIENFDMKLALFGLFPLQEALATLPGARPPEAAGDGTKLPEIRKPEFLITSPPGTKMIMAEPEGSGVVAEIEWEEFAPFASYEDMAAVTFTVRVDGRPTIRVPLTEFFAEPRTFRAREGARRGRTEPIPQAMRLRYFRLPMAYAKNFEIEFHNQSERAFVDERFFLNTRPRDPEAGDRVLRARSDARTVAFWGPRARVGWRRFAPGASAVAESLRFDGAPAPSDRVIVWKGETERFLPLGRVFRVDAGGAAFAETHRDDSETLLVREAALDAPVFGADAGQDLDLAWPGGTGSRRLISTVFWYEKR